MAIYKQQSVADPTKTSTPKAQITQLDQNLIVMKQPRAGLSTEHSTPGEILTLQRVAGNRAISGLIQAKLRVGPVGDAYEQEADRIAEQVMRAPAPHHASPIQRQDIPEEEELQMKPLAATITPIVQRQEEEEEELQMKPLAATTPIVQRQEEEEELQMKPRAATSPIVQRQEEEEEELQMKPLAATSPIVQRQEEEEEELQMKPLSRGGFQTSDDVEHQLRLRRGSGSLLPANLRAEMEARFGVDFDAVRIHNDGEAGQLNRTLHARAFTHGTDIYLGSNEPAIDTGEGKRLLAHELTHVVQQTGGKHSSQMPAKFTGDHNNKTIQRVNGSKEEEEDPFHDPMHPTMSPLVNKRPPEKTEEDPFHDPFHPTMSPLVNKRPPERIEKDPFHDPFHPTMSPLINKRPPDRPVPGPPSKWTRFKGKFSSEMKRRVLPDLSVSSALRQQSRGTTGGLLQGPGVGTRKALSTRPESEGGRRWKQGFAEPEEEKSDSDMVKLLKELLEQLKGSD